MDAKKAVDTVIQPSLNEILGRTIADLVLIKAHGVLRRMEGKPEQEVFREVVGEIGKHRAVLQALGQARVSQLQKDWLQKY